MSASHPPPLFLRRLSMRSLVRLDALAALALTAVCAYAAADGPASPGADIGEPLGVSILAGMLIGAPVAVRRRWPLAVLAVVTVAGATALLLQVIADYATPAPVAAVSFALYYVALATPLPRAIVGLAGTLLVIGVAAGVATARSNALPPTIGDVAYVTFLMAAAWAVGRAVGQRRAYTARAVEQLTDRAVDEERLRIAREVHDIVAHSMSLIAVKAAVANHVADQRPQEVRDALKVIESTSRGALAELRRALGVLRTRTAFAPAFGLADLPDLARRASSAGVAVDLHLPAEARLPEGVGLAVYRIVQESLTNVVKHAAPANCRATVTVGPGEVRIEVSDDGRRPAAPAPDGQGLIGIRERVALFGGEFTAGPNPGGGFTVTARLPYEAAP